MEQPESQIVPKQTVNVQEQKRIQLMQDKEQFVQILKDIHEDDAFK